MTAVDGCSFTIEAGRITGLIGPNGAGKTTCFNMIAGALVPSSGRILLEGQDITGLAPTLLYHRGLLRTFPIPRDFARLTVLEKMLAAAPEQPSEYILQE